jgi:hypothetical protein
MSTAELNWLPIPLDLWVPAGLKDFQQGWFINLLRASLQSEYMGYLILCEEGCSGCPACLWRVANAHHPGHFKKHSPMVLACFNSAQIAGRRVLYFPKLVETIREQFSKIRKHRSRKSGLSEISTGLNNGGGIYSPSESLCFDFDSKTRNKKPNQNLTTCNTHEEPLPMGQNHDFFGKAVEQQRSEVTEGAQRILLILGLRDALLSAAIAAVEIEVKQTKLSMDGIVQRITDDANRAQRLGVSNEEFLADYLAQASARKMLGVLNLPITRNSVSRLAAVLQAEAKDIGLPIEDAAKQITQAASEERRRGGKVDIFYFEDVKWRSSGRVDKAEQRKLNNLEVNARVKQRYRERFGAY